MTHANLCRPIHFFVVAHTGMPMNLTWDQIENLIKSCEGDGFRTLAGDWTGVILTCQLNSEDLPEEIKEIRSLYFFPSSLEAFISKEGLILLLASGWYALFDIPCGVSRDVKQIEPAIKYLERKLGEVTKESVSIKIIKGIRRCLFEHPGAYLGYF
ncbi:MAG: hypothetical protein QXJ52_06175 [Candidatus Korarchaeota archaeon]|nr:hypothetical protein [Thermoproteota archaeon]